MIDPGTGLTILGSAIGGAKIVEKILGPTSDYIGEQLKEWTQKKVANTSKIFKNAEKKLGDKINEEGTVPPKVLKGILEEGAWCEEELQVEYFGGVLASSRSGISRDDRGATFNSIISRLSTYQLRTHYLFYHSTKNYFDGQAMNVGSSTDRSKMEIFIPISTYVNAMDFAKDELKNIWDLMVHSIWGLNREELIETFQYGGAEDLKSRFPKVSDTGILFQPSTLGIELFMWAYGKGQLPINDFFKTELQFNNDQNITIEGSIPVKVENVS